MFARPTPLGVLRVEPRTVVAHGEHEPLAVAPRGDLDLPLACGAAHAVLERVLDDRLQDEIRHERVQRVVGRCVMSTRSRPWKRISMISM